MTVMTTDNDRFSRICSIPEAFRDSGTSLHAVVQASGFADIRGQFSTRDLADYLRTRPAIVEQWVAYSQDKRTSEGWYLRPSMSVGRITREPPPMREQRYPDLSAACAAFIVAELSDILDRFPAV